MVGQYIRKTWTMNERIRLLAEQARIKDHWSIDEARYLTNYLDEKKFAQLIVRECAEIAYNKQYKHSSAHTRGDCAEAIKQHFGVEE